MRIECCSGGPASLNDLFGRLGLAAVGLGRGHLGLLLLLLLDHLDDALAALDLEYQWLLLLHRVVHLRLLPYQLLAQHYQVRFRRRGPGLLRVVARRLGLDRWRQLNLHALRDDLFDDRRRYLNLSWGDFRQCLLGRRLIENRVIAEV